LNPICNGQSSTNITVCSGNGQCIAPNNCSCNANYAGTDCSSFKCFGVDSKDSSVCSSRGKCTRPDSCTCDNGYLGNNCQLIYCFGKNSSDPNVCSSHGQCSGVDRCICFDGYKGDNCINSTATFQYSDPQCVIIGEQYIQYEKKEKTHIIQASICSATSGYGGISIHKGDSSRAFFNIIAWVSPSEGITYFRELDHSPPYRSVGISKKASTGVILPPNQPYSQYQYYNKKKFSVEVDSVLLKDYDYISIVCLDDVIDINSTFQYHRTVHTKYFNMTSNEKSVCDIFSVQGGFSKRLSDTNMPFFYFELSVYIVIFIVAVYFRNTQPLASRGVIPFVVIISQYGASFTSFQNYFLSLEQRSNITCILHAFFYENMLSVIFFLMPVNYLRYVMLININRNKEYVSKKITGGATYFKFITILRKISQTQYTLGIVLVFLVISGLVDGFILVLEDPFVCNSAKSYAIRFIHLAFNFVFGVCLLTIGLIDLVLNIVKCIQNIIIPPLPPSDDGTVKEKPKLKSNALSRCGKGILNFFFYDDPYYFRIEQVLAFIVFGLYVFLELFAFIGVFGTGIENGFYFYFGRVFDLLGRSIVTYMFIIYQALIPLTLVFIKLIVGFIKKNSYGFKLKLSQLFPKVFKEPVAPTDASAGAVEALLHDENVYEILLAFAKEEWSAENVLCWGDISKYKKLKNREKKSDMAFHIHEIYLKGASSPLEINIDTKTREAVFASMNSLDFEFHNELFDPISKALVVNLSDTYSRFILTTSYQNYVRNKIFQEEEMKEF
jgi:hypothetical protein